MRNKIYALLLTSLATRVAPVSYLVAASGLFWGMGFILAIWFGDLVPGITGTILYQTGLLGNAEFWGPVVLTGSLLVLIGMFFRNRMLVQMGSFAGFIMWLFAVISYITTGFVFLALANAMLHVLAHAYFYLASSLGYLWDYKYEMDTE